jgi:hypothetical protein
MGHRRKVDPERVSRTMLQAGRVLRQLRVAAAVRKNADSELRRLSELAREIGVDEASIRAATRA